MQAVAVDILLPMFSHKREETDGGGYMISTPARLQTVHRRNASPHCKHRNSHYFRMRTLRTRVFPAVSAFTT